MLLSNMTKYEPICVKLIDGTATPLSGLTESTRLMDHLVEVFHKGVGKEYNPQAEFHFLASVFANSSAVSTREEMCLAGMRVLTYLLI
jgi:hypothetical protein